MKLDRPDETGCWLQWELKWSIRQMMRSFAGSCTFGRHSQPDIATYGASMKGGADASRQLRLSHGSDSEKHRVRYLKVSSEPTDFPTMSTDSCIPPNIQEIAAPLLLGAVWNWTLYGILVVQVYVYSYNFTKDRRAMKILVYVVFFLETLQTALSGADLYYWFVSGFGDIKHLSNPYTSPYNTPIIGAVIFMVVQFFFSYRIWVLSGWKRTWPLCAVICLLSVVGAGGAFTGAVRTIIYGKFPMGRMLMVEAMVRCFSLCLSNSSDQVSSSPQRRGILETLYVTC
ncbi:hypothetical protein BC834DRAFT_412648 [Gloeopeniophorella convolvens]|nr:hypothetical protein BC834DRAFT_412648 [Gloeopeniophorella convolvens]